MAYIISYDTVSVYAPTASPVKLQPEEVSYILTSSLNRSISTAEQLFPKQTLRSDSLFREFERKILSFPNIKLPLSWWLTGSRVFWFMGINKKGIESISEAKDRARKAASFLANDATSNGKTILVSHGLLNHYLVKFLEKKGWTEVFDGGKGYLSQKVMVKHSH